MGMKNDTTMEENLKYLPKLHVHLPFAQATSLLGTYTKIKWHKLEMMKCSKLLMAAHFVIIKNCKQPTYLSTEDR